MDSVEAKFNKAIEYLQDNDRISMLDWARKTIEQMAKDIYKREFPYRNFKSKDLNSLLKELGKNGLVSDRILPHFRVIQTFGNFSTHESDTRIDEISEEEIAPVYTCLNFLMKWYKEEQRPEMEKNSLQELFVNPYYYKDLKHLKKNDFDEKSLLTDNVVFIVTGSSIYAELIDRPLAAILRDEINKHYPLRAIIISDSYYYLDETVQSRLAISIGNPKVNKLSEELAGADSESISSERYFTDIVVDEVGKAVMWGKDPEETRSIIYSFIKDDTGLKKFVSKLIEQMDDHQY